MAAPTLRTITTLDELRAAAGAWDRLWRASECKLPTLQAEPLALELAHFNPGSRPYFLVVERDGQFEAALPLASRCGLLGSLTGNCWTPSSDMLVDAHCDLDEAVDRLLDGLCAGPWPVVDFHAVDLATPRWQAWRRALERRRIAFMERERLAVGVLRTGATWSQYLSTTSRNHRRQMRRSQRKCDALGGAALRVERAIEAADVESLLRGGFQVEHSSWKGRKDSSVLSTAGIFDFYAAQARCLAARGQLQLSFLELGGKPVAFEYGWLSKGVYFAVKVGYDQAFAGVTPGQLLRWHLFEKLHDEGCWSAIDFLGPLTRASSSWVNDRYTISRLVVAPRRLSGRLALAAYRAMRPLLRRERRGRASGSAAQDDTPADLASTEMALAAAQSAFSEDRSRAI